MVTIKDLIAKNDRDIALFRCHVVRLAGQQGTLRAIGDLERRIAMAERSNIILRYRLV
jgi:hypothetical protein